jgi:molybdopterin molybdotransferase
MPPRILSVEEALGTVLEAASPLPAEEVPYQEALGRILLEEVKADRDHPPFDKSLMDGYAVVAADLAAPPSTLRLATEIAAGRDPERLAPLAAGTAARIMTGAPIPPGADAVLRVEDAEEAEGEPESIRARVVVRPGDNVARRGEDARAQEVLLAAGDLVGAAEIGVLAAVGRTAVKVGGRPRVAVLATGDELVPPESEPGAGEIRNSNGPLLRALARRCGADAVSLGIAPDDEHALRERIEVGLRTDLFLISGGVSMGVYDLVGKALRSAGVEILFERVAIKPGRPFTFGRRGRTLVFGCPGNPVSSYVVFHVFARPALRRLAGFAEPGPMPVRGFLEAPVRQNPARTGYHQARTRWSGDHYTVGVLPTTGSADFASCARGNALAIVPAGTATMEAGRPIDLLLLDDAPDR